MSEEREGKGRIERGREKQMRRVMERGNREGERGRDE